MPELPDIVAYLAALEPRILSQPLQGIRLASPFLLRTAQPPLNEAEGHTVTELRRIGKRIAIGMDNDLWLVLHLMIAGRLHWRFGEALGFPAHAVQEPDLGLAFVARPTSLCHQH
jgi:formamidopyrimidine-DNA glycosylase